MRLIMMPSIRRCAPSVVHEAGRASLAWRAVASGIRRFCAGGAPFAGRDDGTAVLPGFRGWCLALAGARRGRGIGGRR